MYLPSDHKCAIRQGFAAFLLLTPLFFFLDFWWNFRAQMRREGEGWGFYKGGDPGRPGGGGDGPPGAGGGGGDRPPCCDCGPAQRRSPVGRATGPCRPPNGRQGLFFFSPG